MCGLRKRSVGLRFDQRPRRRRGETTDADGQHQRRPTIAHRVERSERSSSTPSGATRAWVTLPTAQARRGECSGRGHSSARSPPPGAVAAWNSTGPGSAP